MTGLLPGGFTVVLGTLAASAAFGAVLATSGPLEEATTPVGADCSDGVVGLLLSIITVIAGSGGAFAGGGGYRPHSFKTLTLMYCSLYQQFP